MIPLLLIGTNMAGFNYLGAKQAGLSDQQIQQSIQQRTGKWFDLEDARKQGLNDQQIQQSITSHITQALDPHPVLHGIGNIAPTALGLTGAIVGSVGAGPLGGAIGGVGGGVLGEDIKQLANMAAGTPLENDKFLKEAGGEALKSGATGAIPTMLPGAGEVAAPLAQRLLVRGVGGALAGGVSQVGSNIAQDKPLMQNVGQGAGLTAALNEIIPGASDAIRGLRAGATATSQQLGQHVAASQVGYGLSDSEAVKPFINKDPLITNDQLIQGMQDKWSTDILPTLKNTTGSIDDFNKAVGDASFAVPPGYTGTKAQFIQDLKGWLYDQAGYKMGTNAGGFSELQNGEAPLELLNKVKTAIGQQFGYDTPIYHAAQGYVEKAAGDADPELADKMFQYGQLRQAADAVASSLSKKGLPSIPGSKAALGIEAVAGGLGYLGGHIPGAIAASGATKGVLDMARNPSAAMGLANMLGKFGEASPAQGNIAKLLMQLGGRGAQMLGQ